jgi:hypothetical protein
MILYVNGDSHTAGAEAVNSFAFAEDDPELGFLGRLPHPDNLAVSWGKLLSQTLKAGFHCGAESGSSNARILRTTRNWLSTLNNIDQVLIIIQWSTWEREEWLHNGVYYQVGASGTDQVPAGLQEKYRDFVIGTDWKSKTQQAHDQIWDLHMELKNRGLDHVFFNGNSNFSAINERHDWGRNYIGPYDPEQSFDSILKNNKLKTVSPDSWHYGRDGHSFWHTHMLKYLVNNNLI